MTISVNIDITSILIISALRLAGVALVALYVMPIQLRELQEKSDIFKILLIILTGVYVTYGLVQLVSTILFLLGALSPILITVSSISGSLYQLLTGVLLFLIYYQGRK